MPGSPPRLSDEELQLLEAEPDRVLRGLSLLARLGEHIGEQPIVVGGFAVETYTQGGYTTADIDALLVRSDAARELLAASGFERRGRHLISVPLDLAVEFPGQTLDSRAEYDRINTIEVPGGEVRMIGVDDLIVDRLCALVHGGATGEFENALRLAAAHFDQLDRDYLRARAASERVTTELDQVLERAQALHT